MYERSANPIPETKKDIGNEMTTLILASGVKKRKKR